MEIAVAAHACNEASKLEKSAKLQRFKLFIAGSSCSQFICKAILYSQWHGCN